MKILLIMIMFIINIHTMKKLEHEENIPFDTHLNRPSKETPSEI